MAEYYPKGHKIPLANGSYAEIMGKLGEGGQGVVYRVKVGGKEYALKWYHKGAVHNPKKFYQNLENNVAKGAPTKAFLWPLYLTQPVDDSFGYIMELRPKNYREFSEFLLAKVHFQSLTAAVNAALNITNGFRELHRNGFSYQDLNDGNFFIDPTNGDVLICDNDNVAPYGESLGIAGKARYMAPEVVRNIKRPDVMTDRFSLSVVLFRLLFLDHPLEGKRVVEAPCLTEELELKFYGKDPIFIYDPTDDSNRPVRGVHSNAIRFWPMYEGTPYIVSVSWRNTEYGERIDDGYYRELTLKVYTVDAADVDNETKVRAIVADTKGFKYTKSAGPYLPTNYSNTRDKYGNYDPVYFDTRKEEYFTDDLSSRVIRAIEAYLADRG